MDSISLNASTSKNALPEGDVYGRMHAPEEAVLVPPVASVEVDASDDLRGAPFAQSHDKVIFEDVQDGVLILCGNECIAANENAVQQLGYSEQELIRQWRKPFEAATFESGLNASQVIFDRIEKLVDLQTARIESQLRPKVGLAFWAELTMTAIEGGRKTMVLIRDLSDRKNAELELKRNRDFLHNIINTIPDQLLVKKHDGEIVLANAAYDHSRVADVITGEEESGSAHHAISKIEATVLESGACHSVEVLRQLPNEQTASAIVRRSLLVDSANGEKYIVATSRDTTAERRGEDRLMMLASVFEGASEGVAILAKDGLICEANPSYAAMTELPDPSQIKGRLLTEQLQLEDAELNEILKSVAEGLPWSGKARMAQVGDKRSFWVSLSQSSQTQSTRIIALVSDITELEATQVKLRQQAFYDNLTGLPNRRFFRDHLNQQILQAQSSGHEIAVCFLDLDDFKHVNDTAGHSTGDRLLQAVSFRIQQTLGTHAFVTRFGGDEFAIILPGDQYAPEKRQALLDKLQAVFRRPFEMPNSEAHVGLSVGVTIYPQDGTDVDTLMCNADIAMYAAKAAGKSQTRAFTPQMQEAVDMRHQVQTKLQHALRDGQITLRYQPKVCSLTGASMGCEALARWQTPDGRFIPPNEFVPVAEQTGLIGALGERVMQTVAKQAAQWAADGILPLVSVNISPQQLRHPNFVQQLTDILAAENAKSNWIELEITEHAMMDDVDHSIEVIRELSELGFRVAVDDFGTGHSSLSYLKHFNIDSLKIDIAFVRDIVDDPQSFAIVQSIISLGHGLDLEVIAEGVETEEQAKLLSEIGCPVLQGYLVGRPMLPEDYAAWHVKH